MSSKIPSFLLGGINLTYNFIGTRTAQTAAFGLFEYSIKLAPVWLTFVAVSQANSSNEIEAPAIAPAAIPERRSSLTQ